MGMGWDMNENEGGDGDGMGMGWDLCENEGGDGVVWGGG